jgi:hypothetical protein
MRSILLPILCLFLFSCEKEPSDALVGSWSADNPSFEVGYFLSFLEDGTYFWAIPEPALDPNCGGGTYSSETDTLIMIEHGWIGIDTFSYIFEVGREKLILTRIPARETTSYTRQK